MDFEVKLKRLEEIVHKMEEGELPLEKSLEMFEEGIRLSRECQSQLTDAEQKVLKLLKVDETGNPTTEKFKTEL
jgi:exodeoxyribonuclease VII small subunit